ncbi:MULTISPECIES: non-homologous end joining protein Ku [unclassified Streptomyces]|uniref:non-homologous end joining protein Ku n=1 Tax=unclassified Streptomyces TaxID=2593676 RepID=UPI002E1C19E7|nr:Ku protein [Streptomyces sp. NBC_01023]
MPRPIWTGAVSFGLVTIPVSVMSATEDHRTAFHQYHQEDMGRVRYEKVCSLDGEVLGPYDIGKAYEVARDQLVPITDEELDQMPLPTAQAIEIAAFVPADSIDPIRIMDGYYLAAKGGVAAKPYTLLRQALERSEKVGIAKFAWHGRERLGMLRVVDDVIVLHSMKWPDEIRQPEDVGTAPDADVSDDEIDAAVQLMETMAREDISSFTDRYEEAVQELIAAKAEHRTPEPVEETSQATSVVDLMEALNASVSAARDTRGEDATVHDIKHAPAKKTSPNKTTAKKTAKKSAARKAKSA